MYRREYFIYGDRFEKCDNNWRYDFCFMGSFDDDFDFYRDFYGEEVDRCSVYSEYFVWSLYSVYSLVSCCSSFSFYLYQSQIYRSYNVVVSFYEVLFFLGFFYGDFVYGIYCGNFNSGFGFLEYGYFVDIVWFVME